MAHHGTLLATSCPTPFGPLAVLATDFDNVVRASGFASPERLWASLPTSVRALPLRTGSVPSVDTAVAAWLDGDGSRVAQMPVSQAGGEFFQSVWRHMRTVPAAETVSYSELALMAGRPRAARAAGTACARNSLMVFVPCHRVIKSDGSVGKYGYGDGLKLAMLAWESKAAARSA